MATAYDIARQQSGLHERRDEAALQDYLYNGGRNLSPSTRAWCADFVNASLAKSGQQGTGSGMARSFASYGQAVDKPEPGDIVVMSRGDPRAATGHVGFYEGVNPDGTIRVFGGNQSNGVGSASYDPSRVIAYRRPEPVSQDAEAQPGGFYGEGTAIPPAASAVATSPSATPTVAQDTPLGGSGYAAAALKIAKAGQGTQPEEPRDILSPVSGGPRGSGRMAEAPIPYLDKVKSAMKLTRASGGEVTDAPKPDPDRQPDVRPDQRGAGRFASPQPLQMPPRETADKSRALNERFFGVGRMPFANGGSVDDTGSNVPETRDALLAQQRQLIEGRRSAQMFPRGTEELPLPPHMQRIETARGVYHFDPLAISAADIERASATGRENDILGLGPLSKDEVSEIANRNGEQPVAITERDPRGNEVRASVATPSTVALQSDEILRSASPDHVVDIEPVEDVVRARGMSNPGDRAMRLARADGGEVSPKKPELNQWDPPWYDKVSYGIGDGVDYVREKFGYEPLSTGTRYGLNQTVQTAPVFKDVKGVDVESKNARRSYDEGDYLGAAGHLGIAGLHGLGVAAPLQTAQSALRGSPSVRQSMREQSAWEANTPSARGASERAASASRAAGDAENLAIRREAELKDANEALRRAPYAEDKQEIAQLIRRMQRGDDIDPADLAVVESVLASRNPGVIDRLREIDPLRVGLYGSAVGAGAYAGDKMVSGEWPNPVRDIVHGVRNMDDQKVDAENQLGGFYGADDKLPSDSIERALRTKREASGIQAPIERARGGGIRPVIGPLTGSTGGRADKIPATARSGSHVIPSDIVSHMGQGNTNAGMTALSKMFKTGPYGVPLSKKKGFAEGGSVTEGDVPVMLSDGEFVVPPEMVAELGGGDIATGHEVLDSWIMDERRKSLETIAALPPPATD